MVSGRRRASTERLVMCSCHETGPGAGSITTTPSRCQGEGGGIGAEALSPALGGATAAGCSPPSTCLELCMVCGGVGERRLPLQPLQQCCRQCRALSWVGAAAHLIQQHQGLQCRREE